MATIADTYVPTWEHRLATHKVIQLDVPEDATLWVHHFDGLYVAATDGPTAHAIYLDVDRYCVTNHAPDECVLCTTTDEFPEDEQL